MVQVGQSGGPIALAVQQRRGQRAGVRADGALVIPSSELTADRRAGGALVPGMRDRHAKGNNSPMDRQGSQSGTIRQVACVPTCLLAGQDQPSQRRGVRGGPVFVVPTAMMWAGPVPDSAGEASSRDKRSGQESRARQHGSLFREFQLRLEDLYWRSLAGAQVDGRWRAGMPGQARHGSTGCRKFAQQQALSPLRLRKRRCNARCAGGCTTLILDSWSGCL